jgi:hypothetical protein
MTITQPNVHINNKHIAPCNETHLRAHAAKLKDPLQQTALGEGSAPWAKLHEMRAAHESPCSSKKNSSKYNKGKAVLTLIKKKKQSSRNHIKKKQSSWVH